VDFRTAAMTALSNDFESSEASRWLQENAWKFGFILRYPSDKIDITGYTYESWHYRFVGVDAASIIHRNHWCLEEYLENQA
jgi:D-alanyl-D-alanine carboxypeptidase